MSLEKELLKRSENKCEICKSTDDLSVFCVREGSSLEDECIIICEVCSDQLNNKAEVDTNHWRCLSDAIWSSIPAVQVVAYRQLHNLSSESWAQDLIDMSYLEDDVKKWANETIQDDDIEPTLDSNGTVLVAGDNVTLIKDLDVKGAGFTAKRGTAVRGISLTNDPEQIEGRVNGTRIVLLTKFLKKS